MPRFKIADIMSQKGRCPINTKMNYPVATLLMVATSEAQQQVPEAWRPFVMIAVLLIGYSLHVFNGHESGQPGGPGSGRTV